MGEEEQLHYINLPQILPSADGTTLLKDPGNFSVYPVALDRAATHGRGGGGGGSGLEGSPLGRSPLRLELTLSAPMDEGETWYLVVLFEHAGKAVFEKGKYSSSFVSFPWRP